MALEASPSADPVLPWHRALWHRLQESAQQHRLPHALLLYGIPGVGKRRLAEQWAQSLLCTAKGRDGIPCAVCRSCRWIAAGNHPDLLIATPDPKAKSDEIKVDTIRDLIERDSLTAHTGAFKIVIIDPADNMNPAAANSLLKTLEEPTPDTLLILTATQPARLPATVRSRCQGVAVRPPAEQSAMAWLANEGVAEPNRLLVLRLAAGAPLAALRLARSGILEQREEAFQCFLDARRAHGGDPVMAAQTWTKLDPGLLFVWIAGWLSDLARLQTSHPSPCLTNPDKLSELGRLSRALEAGAVHRLLAHAMRLRRMSHSTLNWQMAIEAFVVAWAEA